VTKGSDPFVPGLDSDTPVPQRLGIRFAGVLVWLDVVDWPLAGTRTTCSIEASGGRLCSGTRTITSGFSGL
jgi:hypothetical protein